ncbi:MAG TPA: VWA domain-containing protein [Pyrinomonadaceae bacterium]
MIYYVRLLLILFVTLSFSSAAVAQASEPLVLNVTVTTKDGAVIRGLTLDNFAVSVEKTPQQILSLSEREVPASVGILIDTSGSQDTGRSKNALDIQKQFRQGLEGFFNKSNPANDYFAVAFNSKAEVFQDWTSDYQSILKKLDSLKFGKPTSMYDALDLALEKMKTSRNSKQVLILISDGSDNQSKKTFKQVRDKLKSSDVALYCVALTNAFRLGDVESVPNLEGQSVLDQLTFMSGGRALFMNNSQGPKAFSEVFELIALELRSQYQIVIARPASLAGKESRKLKITASRAGTTGRTEQLLARTRQSY